MTSTGYEPNSGAPTTSVDATTSSSTGQPVALAPDMMIASSAAMGAGEPAAVAKSSGAAPIVPFVPGAITPATATPVPVDADSPQRQRLRTEVGELQQMVVGVRNEAVGEAREAMLSQQQQFERTAREFEQQARDVNAAELAQTRAQLESQSRSMVVRSA